MSVRPRFEADFTYRVDEAGSEYVSVLLSRINSMHKDLTRWKGGLEGQLDREGGKIWRKERRLSIHAGDYLNRKLQQLRRYEVAIKTTADLRLILEQNIEGLRDGTVPNNIARTTAMLVRGYIDTLKVELAAAALGKDFGPLRLSTPSTPQLDHAAD